MGEAIAAASLAAAMAELAIGLAKDIDYQRSIKFRVVNNTSKTLTRIGYHMDCGEIVDAPTLIQPGESADGLLKKKFGSFGVKGALIYRWGDDERETLCMFLENPVRGANKSGIKYYWNANMSEHAYYCDVPTITGNREMKHTINEWFTITSFISGGNHAGGAFVLET